MKLVYVANSIIPSRTANSIHVMRMCAALARAGHEVTLCVPGRPGRTTGIGDPHSFYGVERSFPVRYLRWLRIPGRGLAFNWLAARHARRSGAALVYSRLVHAAYFAALRGIPAIFESHAPVHEYDRTSAILLRRLVRDPWFRGMVVISDALRRHYEEAFPQLAGKCRVAADAADDAQPRTGPRLPGDLRVGYAGHLYRGRGIELIVLLAERCPWARFHVVGGLQEHIEAWRARARHVDNVTWHGFCAPAEVQSRMAEMDVLLAPYQRHVATHGERVETSRWMSPLKLFEYMSAGKAIVASDLPVLREVLGESNAVLVDPEDADAWTRALESLRDASLRERLGSRARRDFLERHTWDIRARKVLA